MFLKRRGLAFRTGVGVLWGMKSCVSVEDSCSNAQEIGMPRPYIGICDFTAPEQAERLLTFLPEHFSHDLMVGVMMSRKTLYGIPSKWTNVFPKKESIAGIFVPDMRAMNTIHYADYDIGNDRDRSLAETLARVQSYGGPHLDAIQLDMIWPDSIEVRRFRDRFDIPIVLQVGSKAMKQCGDDPIRVCQRLALYDQSIDYVLFDKSGGEGKGMDAALLSTYIETMHSRLPSLMPAVGGGLGPFTMHLAEPLIKRYRQISTDMQGQMRSSGNIVFPIEWDRAESAFRQEVALFTRYHP